MAKEHAETNEHKEDSEEEEPGHGEKNHGDYSELRERMLRLAAEFDNYKKRTKKELENAESMGKAALMKDILPIVDEFELAILAISDSEDKNIAKGIEMLYTNLVGLLKKEGLSEVGTDGLYDPYKHEIVMVRQSESKDGTILEIIKKGYMFKDRLLRPASVIIAKHGDETEKKSE
ncbi:MAG: nucleotide exchange factor GrpE [Candidatus Micrarchaeota archaeon]|nr:nucleotide exchange factor GrpE [Candidatus Micrarchaeota archaeon]